MAPIITAFTPSVLDVETLEAMFVARQPLLDDLVATVHADVETGSRTHRLLIGPRGIGKTHLITLLDDRLRHDETLSGEVVVAWLREELWEVDTYLAFLEAVLAAIAPTSRSAPGYRETLISLAAPDAERRAEELLWELVGERLLVVLVENLDLLAENLGRDGQARLRAAMENRRQLSMIATTTTMPPDLYNSDAPFYGWFTPSHLDEFTLEEARELLITVARLRNDDDLAEFLTGDIATARLRVVAELAGGSPRVWVLLSQCIDIESIDELVPLFIKMLDDLTPYYQERLRALAPQQRRIVMELCRRGGGVPVNELADSIRADQRSISSQLRTLEKRGLVRTVELPDGIGAGKTDSRLSFYELREPLMRLALDVKESRGEPIEIVVQFLLGWYGRELTSLVVRAKERTLGREYLEAAAGLWQELGGALEPRAAMEALLLSDVELSAVVDDCVAQIRQGFVDGEISPESLLAGFRSHLKSGTAERTPTKQRDLQFTVWLVCRRFEDELPRMGAFAEAVLAAAICRLTGDRAPIFRLPAEQRTIALEVLGYQN